MGKLTKTKFYELYNSLSEEDKEVYNFVAADNHGINVLYVDEDVVDKNGTTVAYKGEIFYNDPISTKVWKAQVFEDHSNATGDTEGYYLLRATKTPREGEITRVKANKNPKFKDSDLYDILSTNLPDVEEYKKLLEDAKELKQSEDQNLVAENPKQEVEKTEPVEPVNPKGGDMENDNKTNNEDIELEFYAKSLANLFNAPEYGVDFWKGELQAAIADNTSKNYARLERLYNNGTPEQQEIFGEVLDYVDSKTTSLVTTNIKPKVPFLKKKSGKALVAAGIILGVAAIAGAFTGTYFGGKTDGQEAGKDPGQIVTPPEDQTAASAETIATAGSTVGDALGKNVEKTILVNGGKTLYTVDNEGRVYKLDLDNKLTDKNVADALGTKYDIQDNIQQVGVDWTKFYNEDLYQKFECYEGVGVKDEFEKYLSRTLGIENNDNLIFIAKVNENHDNTANVDITVIGNKKGNEDVATVEKDYKISDLDKVDSSIPMDDKTGMILLRTMGVGIGDWKCEDITPKQEISKISGTDYAFVDGRNM